MYRATITVQPGDWEPVALDPIEHESLPRLLGLVAGEIVKINDLPAGFQIQFHSLLVEAIA